MANRQSRFTPSTVRTLRGITERSLGAARLLLVGCDQPRLVALADQLSDATPRHFRFAQPEADSLRTLPESSADFVLLDASGPLDEALLKEVTRVATQGFVSVAPRSLS